MNNKEKILADLYDMTRVANGEEVVSYLAARALIKQILNSLSDGWISVEDELPEVNQSVDMVLVDFKSFEGDQDGIDKVYGVYWDGEQWFYEPGIPIENKVLRWIIVEAPGENTNS